MPGRKHSDAERDERIAFLIELHSKGVCGTSDLFRFFSERYPLTRRQFEYDLKKAREQIKEYHADQIEDLSALLVRNLWELYSKNLRVQDYRECRNIIKTISDITGAAQPTKIEHSGNARVLLVAADDINEPATSEDDIDENI